MVLENLQTSFEIFLADMIGFLPRIGAGIFFLLFSYAGIKLVLAVLKSGLETKYQNKLIPEIIISVVAILLWFTAILVFLSIIGMGDIAASLGTATGFVALGVAYALSDMIADTVAGYYLIKGPDFQAGDNVKIEGFEGEVLAIGMRKTRLRLKDNDIAVISNSKIEQEWVKKK